MLALLAAVAIAQETAPAPAWFGPVSVTFPVQFPGNPYDPEVNDIRVRFTPDQGEPVERLAYFADGVWRATLVGRTPGRYRAQLIRNGRPARAEAEPSVVELSQPLGRGFVRVDTRNNRRFRWDDGTPYVPLGMNVGWSNPAVPDIPAFLVDMGARGMNWSRIWACHWDGKNPWWVEGKPEATRQQMDSAALDRWEAIVQAAEKSGVAFQFVLFHHGQVSSNVNPNWETNPWNKASGGWLEKPEDFFTDAEARRRAKMWLRYAVARYGWSPHVMAWELFNEVEWTDGYRNAFPSVVAWHQEMAEYLRSIDATGRLVTTSSKMQPIELYSAADFYQPHTYPPDVFAAHLGQPQPGDKPIFFGEFGPNNASDSGDAERHALRDGLLGGLLANHAGPGAYWFWDRFESRGLAPEFENVRKLLTASGWAERASARPAPVFVETAQPGAVVLRPGRGWGATERFRFELPNDATPANTGLVSSYLQAQSGNNKALFAEPLSLSFTAKAPGKLTVRVTEVSSAGGTVRIQMNGRVTFEKSFPGEGKNRPVDVPVEAVFPAGPVSITIDNPGPDWVVFSGIEVEGMGPAIRATALNDADWTMLRLTTTQGASVPLEATLSNLNLVPGEYEVYSLDLETGTETTRTVSISGAGHRETIQVATKDQVLVFRRRPAN